MDLVIWFNFIKVLNYLCNSNPVSSPKLDKQLTFSKLEVFEYASCLGPVVISLETTNSQLH